MLTIDSFFPNLSPTLAADTIRLVGGLDEFKGHWRRLKTLNTERLKALRQVSTIESTGSSTRIEGSELSNDEVAKVLQGIHMSSFRARDEQEVKGYGELLSLVFERYEAMPLTENHIKQLHEVLLRYSTKDERHRGEYKKFDNHVVATYPDGRKEVVFQTESPFATPFRMADLVTITNSALDEGRVHPLIVIGRFIVDFLSIHPFQDGNGRLSRAMTTLLLLRSGYAYVPYASLERVVEENKQSYYAALRDSQTAMRSDPAAFGEWLLFFLRSLDAQKQTLVAKLDLAEPARIQNRIKDYVAAHGQVLMSDMAEALQIPARTVRYQVGLLVKKGVITAHGKGRGRYYTI